ncbi:sensor histidine kinase [Nocardiopsis potens]|uniref:sensor histidine kinase n=1 Tax=Nocardiopsis potens TaxID=1246458 RepID=UPI00034CD8C9|nr:sensor histidine kinase [Nocardiopsis potens]
MTSERGAAEPAGGRGHFDRRLRVAGWTVIGMLLFVSLQIPFYAVTLLITITDAPRGAAFWLGVAGVVVSVALSVLLSWMLIDRVRHGRRDRPWPYWGSFALTVLIILLVGVFGWTMLIAAVWWSVAAITGKRRWTAAGTLVLLVLPWAVAAFVPDPPWGEVLLVFTASVAWGLIVLFGNVSCMWLWDLAKDALAGREAQTRLAVSEERLRFARDMHDLLGHSLSGIAVKSELAARLAERDPARAAEEMRQVQGSAREALREVRMAVSGYRQIDLAEELGNVRGVLVAAGARCEVSGRTEEVPAELRTLAAWVVREAGTNVVRHSAARRCDITLRRSERTVTVEVYNDGVAAGPDPERGNGVTGLAERVAAVGGSLSASRSGADGFLLRAVLPVASGGDRERIAPGASGPATGAEGARPAEETREEAG